MRQIRHSKEWVAIQGVADYCMVDPVTVRRWIKSGRLPAMRLPSGHYRIAQADFITFLKKCQMPVEDYLLTTESEKSGDD